MARIRTIKPEIVSDEKLATVSRDARLTFVWAITQADDDGLIPGNPRQLLATLYPNDDHVTDKILTYWLSELDRIGVIRWRETTQGAPVLQIVKWNQHQKISNRGKSLILHRLKAIEGVSDDPLEGLASVSRESLFPTLDHGPRTMDPRPAKRGDGNSVKDRSSEMFGKIRALIAQNQQPGQAPVRFIPLQEVERLGEDVAAAYQSVGGSERFLGATGDGVGYLLRDFRRVLGD